MNIMPFFKRGVHSSASRETVGAKRETQGKIKFEVRISLLTSFFSTIANKMPFFTTVCLLLIILFNVIAPQNAIAQLIDSSNYYRSKKIHNPDGIGKYYMNREIAQVMGHQAMMWLEREGREREERPQSVIEHLNLQPTDTVADIGTGTGYFATRIAPLVSQGKVYAVDIQPEMLDVVNSFKKLHNITNIETILGTQDNPNLPKNSIDLALMVDAYHEFAYPREMMENLYQSLKSGGKVILVEYRQENPMIMIKPLHKMSQKQVKKEMQALNLKWLKTEQFLPEQHFMIFVKAN